MMNALTNNGKRLSLVIFLVFSFATAFAGTDPTLYCPEWKGRYGSIKVDTTRAVSDIVFYAAPSSIEHTFAIRNLVGIAIDETSPFFIQTDFTFTVELEITKTKPNGTDSVFNKELTVNYKKTDGQKYNAQQYVVFGNGAAVSVKILSVNNHSASWDVTKVLMIKNELTATRDYVFSCSTLITGLAFDDPIDEHPDEVELTWGDPANGQTEYDLEWAWIEESAWPLFQISSAFVPSLVFDNNTTRVTVSQPTYKIPLLYDGSGKLFVRVRPAQLKENGQRVEGSWSYTSAGTSGSMLSFAFDGHEEDLNWQATTSYAEEGKRKSVVQYFDGTLRGRQTVTKDNTTQTTIVAETFYDYQGRPVIQVLPAPTINTIISYSRGFNQFVSSTNQPKTMYDKLETGEGNCIKPATALSNSSGTANYYSSSNSDAATEFNRFIPDASGYPFAETRYTPDATGRIAAQSGVGVAHKLGSGHETKYFYETPDQQELDALFGTDAGYAAHYFKNLVKDANGQYSVSYVDMHGRTVATALAGDAPDSLQQLSSYNSATITKNLLDPETNRVVGKSIISSKSLIVTKSGNYTFDYDLVPFNLQLENCESTEVCYDCLYDLKITITSECENVSGFTNPYTYTHSNFTLGTYLNNCSDDVSPLFNENFTVSLPEGAYTVTKELKMHTPAQNYYRDEVFLAANTCKTLQDFVNEEYAILQTQSNCNMTCESCNAALGLYSTFRANFIAQAGPFSTEEQAAIEPQIQAAYNEAKANCDRICHATTDDGFDQIRQLRQLMLMDVTPGTGQYGRVDVVGRDTMEMRYNVLNQRDVNSYEMNYQSAAPDWRHPLQWNSTNFFTEPGTYKDENGEVDPVNSQILGIKESDFILQFKPSWAEALLPHHPEYCKLITTERFLKPSYQFQATMQHTDTWSQAASGGFINNILNVDPFFANSGSPGYSYRSTMLAKMNVFATIHDCNDDPANLSMWQLAQGYVFCKDMANDCFALMPQLSCILGQSNSPSLTPSSGCETDWNRVWQFYRSIYLSQRQLLINEFLESQCPNVNNTDILSFNGVYTLRFPGFDELQTVATQDANLEDLFDQIGASSMTNSQTSIATLNAAQADTTCRSYATMWINRLKECPTLTINSGDETWLMNNLVAICKGGFDDTHPQGSSSMPGSLTVHDAAYNLDYHDFPDVIRQFLSAKSVSISSLCHPYMLDFPKPYENTPAMMDDQVVTKPTTCQCEMLSTLKTEYTTYNFPGNFSQYLSYQYGTHISQGALDTLIALCNGTYTCKFLPSAIVLPPVLQCTGAGTPVPACINCMEYTAIKTAFATEFGTSAPINEPADDTERALNDAFASFANFKTGFSKHWSEYVAFGLQCDDAGSYTCGTLDSLVTLFYSSESVPTEMEDCKSSFTSFFNTHMGTFYTFEQIMQLYRESCGEEPDVCKPRLDCTGFKNLVNQFYDQYGVGIYLNPFVKDLFTAFMNQHLQMNFSYEDIQSLYGTVCQEFGCTLRIDTLESNVILLPRFLQSFHELYDGTFVNTSECEAAFVAYFLEYFDLKVSYTYGQVMGLFPSCLYDTWTPCAVLTSTSTQLNNLVAQFYSDQMSSLKSSESCQRNFTSYFNTQQNTHFTWTQVQAYYLSICGIPLALCDTLPSFNCKALSLLVNDFTLTGTCDVDFATHFNAHFSTSYTYAEIEEIYLQSCGQPLLICNGENPPLSCDQLKGLEARLRSVVPDPVAQWGSDYQDAYAGYFRMYFGVAADSATIDGYFSTLCSGSTSRYGSSGTCSDTSAYKIFVDWFNVNYDDLLIPTGLRRDLFTLLFNTKFGFPLIYDDIQSLLSCYNGGDLIPADGINYDLHDPAVLLSIKQAYFLMNPDGLPFNCTEAFTAWFNLYFVIPVGGVGGPGYPGYDPILLTYDEIINIYENYCGPGTGYLCGVPPKNEGVVIIPVEPVSTAPRLCGLNEPIFVTKDVEIDPCKNLHTLALSKAEERYTVYIDSLKNVFDSAWLAKCASAKEIESFTVTHGVSEYHYTLYYYDQAGQLVRTIPPEGVDDKHGDATFLTNVKNARAATAAGTWTTVVPTHRMPTDYRYNTLGQVMSQKTPDAGTSNFWYDRLGRLVISRNAQQAIDGKYSYTVYDALGRISEVGQKPHSTAMTQTISRSSSSLASWMAGGSSKQQITRTVYDLSYFDGDALLSPIALVQKNLRNRVSYVQVFDTEPMTWVGTHRAATYYTYDIHGNVDTLLQDYAIGAMADAGNALKKIVYDYDLISGKVNQVSYQPGQADQFYHKYEYDAENRLTNVQTSNDGWVWERDARYEYYKHGPLARTVLGQQQVQGIDYAYTIQGWLKGVNSTDVGDGSYDMGADGKIGGTNISVARDVYGYSLNYFSYDYTPIHSTLTAFSKLQKTLPVLADNIQTGGGLYNGNIRGMLVNIPKLVDVKLYGYRYDQLNRIVGMNGYGASRGGSDVLTLTSNNDYMERIAYDANGNIKTYIRRGYVASGNRPMDSLTYGYNLSSSKLVNNKLRHVKDGVSSGNYTEDIDDQADDNYSYDAIGNLTSDAQQSISNISWTVYGKIASITKGGNTISYTYDANGNRISKTAGSVTTWYVRDATGNVMSIYENGSAINSGDLTQTEAHLYGSSRLGIFRMERNVENPDLHSDGIYTFERGDKFFELSNHLGNVLATVNDRKAGIDDDADNDIDHYEADVASATDYYPFGMGMVGRKWNGGDYRYGFNGKEADRDLSDPIIYDYGFRIYNSGIGRFLTVDPLEKQFSELTPYQFASNSPIEGIDLDGKEYVSSKVVRLEVIMGMVTLKVENMTSVTKNNLQSFANDPNNWDPEGKTIGVAFNIGSISLGNPQSAQSTADADPADANTPKTTPQGDIPVGTDKAKSTGLPDRRYKQRSVTAADPGGAKGLAIAAVAIAGVELVAKFNIDRQLRKDQAFVETHVKFLKKAISDVNAALKANDIPPELNNSQYLSDIINVVLCGESSLQKYDPKIGAKILKAGLEIIKKYSSKRGEFTGRMINTSKLDGHPNYIMERNPNWDAEYEKNNPPAGDPPAPVAPAQTSAGSRSQSTQPVSRHQ